MNKANLCIWTFAVTLVIGFIGMIIDSNAGLDGNFSIVAAIATVGAFIVYAINNNNHNDNNDDNNDDTSD